MLNEVYQTQKEKSIGFLSYVEYRSKKKRDEQKMRLFGRQEQKWSEERV
jgi:hypothetical protein